MSLRIERPKAGKQDKQMEEIVHFMIKTKEQIIEYPVIFIAAWSGDKLKIFTKRDKDGKIISMCIISVFENPVDGMKTFIESFTAGNDDIFEECVKFLRAAHGITRTTDD